MTFLRSLLAYQVKGAFPFIGTAAQDVGEYCRVRNEKTGRVFQTALGNYETYLAHFRQALNPLDATVASRAALIFAKEGLTALQRMVASTAQRTCTFVLYKALIESQLPEHILYSREVIGTYRSEDGQKRDSDLVKLVLEYARNSQTSLVREVVRQIQSIEVRDRAHFQLALLSALRGEEEESYQQVHAVSSDVFRRDGRIYRRWGEVFRIKLAIDDPQTREDEIATMLDMLVRGGKEYAALEMLLMIEVRQDFYVKRVCEQIIERRAFKFLKIIHYYFPDFDFSEVLALSVQAALDGESDLPEAIEMIDGILSLHQKSKALLSLCEYHLKRREFPQAIYCARLITEEPFVARARTAISRGFGGVVLGVEEAREIERARHIELKPLLNDSILRPFRTSAPIQWVAND